MTDLDTPLLSRPKGESPPDPGLSVLRAIVGGQGRSTTGPASAARDRLTAMAAAWRPAQDNPPDLFGRKCHLPAPEWHLRRLLELVDVPEQSESEAVLARRLYHARWLGHLLLQDQAEFRPHVTILIPVYNRATMAVEAVESCLAQTWKPLEILVVDDGSIDDLAGALARFGDAVRVVRQPNGGVASARNTGIRQARGDFIHFLDSDNLLRPTAVARKVDGFACFPDAELCYSLAEIDGERTLDLPQIVPPNGTADCPTVSMLESNIRYPFYVSCVMLPRFTLLATGGFEEDLRRGEDTRFWIKLALRDTKVIGLDAKLTIRRVSASTLSAPPMPRSLHLLIRARTIADLLGTPRAWTLAARYFPGLLHILLQDNDEAACPSTQEGGIPTLLIAIAALAAGHGCEGSSPLPILAHLRHLARRALDPDPRGDGAALIKQICAALDAAARTAAPLTRPEVSFWAQTAFSRRSSRRLNTYFSHAETLLRQDGSLLAAIDELLRGAPTLPRSRTIDDYIRLRRPAMPRRIALWLALRKAD
jgi:hypothetical protein